MHVPNCWFWLQQGLNNLSYIWRKLNAAFKQYLDLDTCTGLLVPKKSHDDLKFQLFFFSEELTAAVSDCHGSSCFGKLFLNCCLSFLEKLNH